MDRNIYNYNGDDVNNKVNIILIWCYHSNSFCSVVTKRHKTSKIQNESFNQNDEWKWSKSIKIL